MLNNDYTLQKPFTFYSFKHHMPKYGDGFLDCGRVAFQFSLRVSVFVNSAVVSSSKRKMD
jgi:hypothetical protein